MVSFSVERRSRRCGLLLAAVCLFAASASLAQKTDVNVNIYGAFPMSATGPTPVDNSVNPPAPVPGGPLKQSADSSIGVRAGVRHIFSPIFGLEVNYGFNRAVQHFSGATSSQDGPVFAHAKPLTVDYVATAPFSLHGVRPFLLAGGGYISYTISSYPNTPSLPPGQTSLPARPEKIPVFEYGIGADFHPGMLPRFMDLRLQYRGLIGHAPDFRLPILATNNVINIAEPQAGLVFKF